MVLAPIRIRLNGDGHGHRLGQSNALNQNDKFGIMRLERRDRFICEECIIYCDC